MPLSYGREIDKALADALGDIAATHRAIVAESGGTDRFRNWITDLEDADAQLRRARNILRRWALDVLSSPRGEES